MVRYFHLLGIMVAVPLVATGAPQKPAGSAPAALKTFLEGHGYGGSSLQRRYGNHLYVTGALNGKRTSLVVDTGCPFTLIDRSSASRTGLAIKETKSSITGVFGVAKRFGVGRLKTLALGNCTFLNVPVQIAEENDLNQIRGPHMDGLFGAYEMAKFGMVIDCARQMMYVNPKGSSAGASDRVAQFLRGRGFTRIPMHLNANHHLEIDVGINGHPTRMIVDTGASTTLLSASIAQSSGASLSYQTLFATGTNNIVPVGVAHVRQLTLGNLIINNADVTVAGVAKFVGSGLLGEEYLSRNFAVIDVGGMALYLRPPDPR